jgi:hypothetical protein
MENRWEIFVVGVIPTPALGGAQLCRRRTVTVTTVFARNPLEKTTLDFNDRVKSSVDSAFCDQFAKR